MAQNMKIHILPISIISVVIIVLYLVIGPKPEEPPAPKPTDRFVRVGNATWGLSCNTQIGNLQQSQDTAPLAKDKDGKVIKVETMKKVMLDNVLTAVKKICEGQMECGVSATDDALGVTLPVGCYKVLNVNYRCSDVDRLVTTNTDQGQTLKIDCTAPDATATAPQQP